MFERIFALILAVSGVAIYLNTLGLPEAVFDPIGPAGLPQVLSICLIVVGVAMAIVPAPRKVSTDLAANDEKSEEPTLVIAAALFAATIVYLYLVSQKFLGYIPATALFMFIAFFVLDSFKFNVKILGAYAVFSVGAAIGLGLLFTKVFVTNLSL